MKDARFHDHSLELRLMIRSELFRKNRTEAWLARQIACNPRLVNDLLYGSRTGNLRTWARMARALDLKLTLAARTPEDKAGKI